jgi:cytochrome P450
VDRVRPICESAVDPLTGDIDSVQLSRSPLLQSILAEVLRIRVQGMIVRSTTRSVEVEGWTFPKHAYLMAPSNFGNFNESVWNTGTAEAPHPLDTFWPERFLIYPDDPTSGPLRTNQTTDTREKTDNSEGPKYSEHGLKGVYFPFGGSMHPCPGRQFSQFEVLNTLAILVLNYDVEICVEPGWTPKMKTKHFAFGTLPPAQQAPFRIRRKNVA